MTRIHMRATAAALLLLLLGAHAVAAARSLSADDDVQPAAEGHPPMWAKGQALVQFREGATPAGKADAMGRMPGAQPLKHIADVGGGLVLVALPPGAGVAASVHAFKQAPAVAFAEPNIIYQKITTSFDDPLYACESFTSAWDGVSPVPCLWGMKAGGGGSDAEAAWAAEHKDCRGVYVGVIDEGIDDRHPDLEGVVDVAKGWNYYDNNADVPPEPHGTHVAGTIGAVGNNVGVVGVCTSGIKLISLRFLGPNGGSTSDAVSALNYLVTLKKNGVNVVASSNSWGCDGPERFCHSTAMDQAIAAAGAVEILFIAAAGNAGSTRPMYPAATSLPSVIAVAAVQPDGRRASFSNYGSWVHIAAPGQDITSTVPGGRYDTWAGTSMATPHVTGAAALYAATYHGATAAQIKAAILGGVDRTSPDLTNVCSSGGRLNIPGMLAVLPAAPPPTCKNRNAPCTTGGQCCSTICKANRRCA